MSLIQPDRYFSRTSAINVEWDIVGKGFTHVLLDIDNTILSRADHQVPADVRRWLVRVRAAGVKMCFLSNNFHGNVFDLGSRARSSYRGQGPQASSARIRHGAQ